MAESIMSKKHFVALADAIRFHNEWSNKPFSQDQIATLARVDLAAMSWGIGARQPEGAD
jgi:hypothetical protein